MLDTTLCLLISASPAAAIWLGYKKIGFGKGKYTGFGGKVEAGETVCAAALRELAEETGLVLPERALHPAAILRFHFPHCPAWSQQVHVFTADPAGQTPLESAEMRPARFELAAIPYPKMWDDARYWLPPILAGQCFQADFSFQADNATVETVAISAWQAP